MNLRRALVGLCLVGVVGISFPQRSYDVDILAETFGFDENTTKSVNLADLRQGCPARDCIPFIDNPKYVTAETVSRVGDDDQVVAGNHGVSYYS